MNSFGLEGSEISLDSLPCYAEILERTVPGETQLLWQMSKDCLYEGDPEWLILPDSISLALDREYAKFCSPEAQILKVRPITAFAVHVTFGHEMPFSWLQARTSVDKDGIRRMMKGSKTYCVVNFDRKNVRIQLDTAGWRAVRCVRVTHQDGGQVMQPGTLAALLQDRLAAYQDSEGEGGEMDDEKAEADEEAQENAEQEGVGDLFNGELRGDGCEDEQDWVRGPQPSAYIYI